MHGLVATHGERGDVPPIAVPSRAAELFVTESDTVAAAAEDCDAPVATGVVSTGMRR
jgi:hypothetical protein